MGLKLPAPARWCSPLGDCQTSAFDEFFSNPRRGELEFHQADGKAIRFERPFNFLPSINGSFPHLELKAPWLRQLTLKDRRIVKHFRQYPDSFYRLEKIEDLNGNTLVFQRSEAGVLQRIDADDGLALVFANDAAGRRTGITLIGIDGSEQLLATYAYDARGRMVSADCSFGMSVRYDWHETRPLLLCWHNLTRRSETRFTYDAEGRVVHTATTGIWNDDRFRYDTAARETVYLPGGEEARAQRFAYDEHENVTAEIDALGGAVRHDYDRFGFRIATTDANGHESRTRYDSRGNVMEAVDAEGRSTVYNWGDDGELIAVFGAAGNRRSYDHDDRANVVTEIDTLGTEIHFERDDRGRLVKTIFPDGSEERRAYDGQGRLIATKDAKGGITRFAYDAFGRLVETTDVLGGRTVLAYVAGAGGFATPTSVTRPDGVAITRSFDAEGSLSTVTDGEGRSWRYEFGAFEVLQAIIDPKGGRLGFSYDNEGRLLTVTNATGRVYRLDRNLAGRVVREVDFDGRATAYRRDPGGRVVEVTKPDGARLVYGYDKTDRVTRIESFAPGAVAEDGPEDVTRFWYDGAGRLEKAENGAALVELKRDRNGAIVGEALNGRWVDSTLDAMGRRVERRIGDSLVAIAHDPLGLVARIAIGDHAPLAFTRDALGREVRREGGAGFYLDQSWDAVGQLLGQMGGHAIDSHGGLVAARQAGLSPLAAHQIGRDYRWDKASSPLSIADTLWGTASYSYDENGQVARARFGEALAENFRYDAARNLVGAGAAGPDAKAPGGTPGISPWQVSPGGVVGEATGPRGERLRLAHDACGRVVERVVERNGFRPRRWRYAWDAQDRLVRCTTPDGAVWRYGYDPFGRRVWKVKELTPAERRAVAQRFPDLVDPASLPPEGYPMLASGASVEAPQDDRPPVVGTHYLWDGDVVAEEAPLRLDGGVDWAQATRWHYEPGGFRPLAKEAPDGTLFYIVTDHLGTPREMVDEQGDVRWAASLTTWGVVRDLRLAVPANDDHPGGLAGRAGPRRSWGNLALKSAPLNEVDTATLACPIRFQGQWQDEETGLYYNRHRHYDPLAGQYASPDPVKLEGGVRPQAYVESPYKLVDPRGLGALSPAAQARSWQGKGDYPGVDNWSDTTIKKGRIVYGGTPGQSEYYTNADALIGSIGKPGGSQKALWESLQVKPHRERGHRPHVTAYRVQEDIPAATALTLENPKLGPGGATQYFIPKSEFWKLEPVYDFSFRK